MTNSNSRITDAIERLTLALGETGAVPTAELARALERAAERLRGREAATSAVPEDLVSQAEAARRSGVTRQTVNQWVQRGTLRTHVTVDDSRRRVKQVSIAEVSVAAQRRTSVPLPAARRLELISFLHRLEGTPANELALPLAALLEERSSARSYRDESRVLREFVIAAMDTGAHQQEFTAEGVRLLAELNPTFAIDPDSSFGALCDSLDLLVRSSHGCAGFDSPTTAVLGLIGVGTVGAQYPDKGTSAGRDVAKAGHEIWGDDWVQRMYDVALHLGDSQPWPLTRLTASLTYLDFNRFLRQAQSTGVTISYSRGPGLILPERFYGAAIFNDIVNERERNEQPWAFSAQAAAETSRPTPRASPGNPFRIFNYRYGLLDTSIHGIRRYSFSATDVGNELRRVLGTLPSEARSTYIDTAVRTLAESLSFAPLELTAIDRGRDFDWWKDHVIRSSEQEILIGLRDEEARRTAHAILVRTRLLPQVVSSEENDSALRDRLRIYVKNLEYDVISARFQDDVQRGVARMVKAGGVALTPNDAESLARAEIERYLD